MSVPSIYFGPWLVRACMAAGPSLACVVNGWVTRLRDGVATNTEFPFESTLYEWILARLWVLQDGIWETTTKETTIFSISIIGLIGGYWVYRDALKRGVYKPAFWGIVVFALLTLGFVPGLLALAVYFYLRPEQEASEAEDGR